MGELTTEFEKMYSEALNDCGARFLSVVNGREVVSCRGSDERRVYVLRDADSRRTVLKQFSIDQKEHLKSEHAILLSGGCAGLPAAGEYSEDEDWAYLTREYVEGMNLAELQAYRGKLSLNETLDIAIAVCDILIDLHSREPKIIHRDIKPENIIYTPDKRVVLIDFDIAREYDAAAENDTVYLGTKKTAPPEQFGYGQTDPRSDIYSLGVTLIYLYTGGYDIRNLDSLPKGFKRICEKCTDFSPKGRYQSAAELKQQLKRLRSTGKRAALISVCAAVVCGLIVWGAAALIRARQVAAEAEPVQEEAAAPTVIPTALLATEPDGAVEFVSPVVETYVRGELGISESESVYESDLMAIDSLYMFGDRAFSEQPDGSDRDGEYAFADGSPYTSNRLGEGLNDIAKMQGLKNLTLFDQGITDASALASLWRLEGLELKRNPVVDISALGTLTRLRRLGICNTLVEDISVIKNMPYLENLDMNSIYCTDYSPLASAKMYSFLDISGSDAASALPCIANKRVEVLKLCRCGLENLTGLVEANVTGLSELHLDGNNLKTLSGLEAFDEIEYLNLSDNEELTDLSPLLGMDKLQELEVDESMRDAVDSIVNKADFEVVYN